MELPKTPNMPPVDPRLMRTLVNEYLHQLGESRVVDVYEAPPFFDEQRLAVATLLSSEGGRDTLFPNLANRANLSHPGLREQRALMAERLAILFSSAVTVKSVATKQLIKPPTVRSSLAVVFRRTAVISESHPELLQVTPVPFNKGTLWPSAPVARMPTPGTPMLPKVELPLSGSENSPIMLADAPGGVKARLEDALEPLRIAEQEALILFLGLDGKGNRPYAEVADRLAMTVNSVRRLTQGALSKLERNRATPIIADFFKALQAAKPEM